MVRGEALRAYRDLMRAARKSFFGNPMLVSRCTEDIRERFNKNRHVNSDIEIQKLLRRARIALYFISTKFYQPCEWDIEIQKILRHAQVKPGKMSNRDPHEIPILLRALESIRRCR